MKKYAIAILLGVGAVFLMVAVPALAVKPNGPAADNGLNKGGSDKMHLELYEKENFVCVAEGPCWTPVENGAFGRMNFDEDKFVFNGHRLVEGEHYALIRYLDPWSGDPVLLGHGYANERGDVHISGEMECGGPKVWLVLYDDVDCGEDAWSAWNPESYLFEYNLLPCGYACESSEQVLDILYGSSHYLHDMSIDGPFPLYESSGTGSYPAGGSYSIHWTMEGMLSEDGTVKMRIDYDGIDYWAELLVVEVNYDCTMEGTWRNDTQSGTWETSSVSFSD